MHELPVLSGVPVVGALPEFRRSRIAFLDRAWREGGGLTVARLVNREVLVITEPEAAREVLTQRASSYRKFEGLARFARPVLGDGLITAEGDKHRRQRKLITPGMTHRRIGGYVATMARHADELVTAWRDAGEVDVHGHMTRLTLAIATETMFSSSSEQDAEAAGAAVHAATRYIASELGRPIHVPMSWPTPRHLRLRRAVSTLERLVLDILAERRASPTEHDDLLAMLLAARDEDDGTGMTDTQVRDEVMTLFVAGHETTANALSWSLYLLARHPEIADRLAAESRAVLNGRPPGYDDLGQLPYALQVFKEAMRLYPPAYMVGREALEDTEVAGHRVPAGTTVLVSIWGLHHRADLFAEPDRFDPDRFESTAEKALPRGAYLPFATGPRVCVGNHFALVEGQVVLSHVAQHLALESLGPEVRPLPQVTLRPGAPIRLRVSSRG